jgi:GDPmannose 4,6-dehydratase
MAFKEVGIGLEFKGKDENETAVVVACNNPEFQVAIGKEVVAVDKRYYRPTEVDLLIGDPSKAQKQLGWKPTYDLPALVKEMMGNDVDLFRKDKLLQESGYYVRNQFE